MMEAQIVGGLNHQAIECWIFEACAISPSTSSIVRRIGCSESYCAGMTLGQPEISIAGLNELASVLASFNANRKRSAQSNRSIKPE
jgi:hypothetical protein